MTNPTVKTRKPLKTVDEQIETLKGMGQEVLAMIGKGRPGMTTVTIAEITGRPHDSVLKKARKFLSEIGGTVGDRVNSDEIFCDAQETVTLDSYKREQPALILSRDVAQAFLATYNAKLVFALTVCLNGLLNEIDPDRAHRSDTALIAEALQLAEAIREKERCDWRAFKIPHKNTVKGLCEAFKNGNVSKVLALELAARDKLKLPAQLFG